MDGSVIPAKADSHGTQARTSSGWAAPLLPNEPRIPNLAAETALTQQHLLPVLAELEACMLAVRTQLDPELQRARPVKLGKPYPLGQCLEIAEAVQARLRTVAEADLAAEAAAGLRAFRAFQKAGGTFRMTWGALREQYFQNAFLLGTLYLDVSNDTVVRTKPKVEILPFEQAQYAPIQDFEHYRQIVASYWQDEVYPNHVLPAVAPYCPLIHVDKTGLIQILDPSQYMVSLTKAGRFEPSEAVLRASPMPPEVFEQVADALQSSGHVLTGSPEEGRRLALQHCRQYRAKRWHQSLAQAVRMVGVAEEANLLLAQWLVQNRQAQPPPELPQPPQTVFAPDTAPAPKPTTMVTITIDNREYDLASLSAEARQQIDMLAACDKKLQDLQIDFSITQAARNAYAAKLSALLPPAD